MNIFLETKNEKTLKKTMWYENIDMNWHSKDVLIFLSMLESILTIETKNE